MTVLAIGTYLGLNDCKVASLSTDVASTAATYGSLMDININQMDISSVNYTEAELRYDEILGDVYSKIESIEGSMVAGTFDLDVVAMLTGGTVGTTGSGTAAITSFGLGGDDVPVYCKIAFKTEYDESTSSVKDKHITICKAKVNVNFGTISQGTDGYTTFTFNFKAIPLKGTYATAAGDTIDKAVIAVDHYGAVTAIS